MTSKIMITESSGNVFADLGLPRPKERMAKTQIAHAIVEALMSKGLKQGAAAKILKIPQPKVSLLMNGKLAGFSLEKLIELLELLGQEVEISVSRCEPSPERAKGASMFRFPVPSPRHPILAAIMPKWDYEGNFCLSRTI